MIPRRLSVDAYVDGVRAADRAVLSRAITLVESALPADRALAAAVLDALGAPRADTVRVGVSGVPGAGKSTMVEALGLRAIDAGRRVAVLAIDPSSGRTGGSILGDKTRMTHLSASPQAFVRPSPTRGHLGGIGRRSRETLLLVEAAGFDLVFVETVGVGQSETTVAGIVDTVLLVLLAGAGDDLQGIKRGILEVADVVAVNKADGDHRPAAEAAARELAGALSLLHGGRGGWMPPVLPCSAVSGAGLSALWDAIEAHRAHRGVEGLASRRRAQALAALDETLHEALRAALDADPAVVALRPSIDAAVASGELPATVAADRLVAAWRATSRDRSEG